MTDRRGTLPLKCGLLACAFASLARPHAGWAQGKGAVGGQPASAVPVPSDDGAARPRALPARRPGGTVRPTESTLVPQVNFGMGGGEESGTQTDEQGVTSDFKRDYDISGFQVGLGYRAHF